MIMKERTDGTKKGKVRKRMESEGNDMRREKRKREERRTGKDGSGREGKKWKGEEEESKRGGEKERR